MKLTDENLLQRVSQGDADAFEQLYERHSGALARHLQRLVRDPVMADDLLQEVFLRVWERAAQYKGSGSPRSWLYQIASNLALNHLDAVPRRRQQSLEPASMDDDDGDSPLPAWFVDETAITPDAALEQLELRRLLRGVVAILSESKQRVIELVYRADLEISAAATELSVPEGTIKSRLHHARRLGSGRLEGDHSPVGGLILAHDSIAAP